MVKSDLLFYLATFLFCSGLLITFTKQNAIMILIGIELMLNAANLNLVVFNYQKQNLNGQLFALFIILVAVCEAAVGIAIILKTYHYYHTSVPDQINELKEKF
ncbi:MAG: NADH-quinone oxidoreductase subunit NuoK [Cyclobacteriaceae bacterium]|jgi:NADH:ubiquinone oxidoreductase subunit K|nr:NADH-quinone oxidoreductase subunit NuoK [Cyclobacteriaceae bacterium]